MIHFLRTSYLVFLLMGQYARTEVHSSLGRSDVKAKTDNAIYNFEFKVGGKPPDAIIQIKDAGYAEKYGASSKDIFLIGATISRNKKTLGRWKIEKIRTKLPVLIEKKEYLKVHYNITLKACIFY